MTYTEKELDQFLHGISLSLLSKKSAQHWRYDEETAKEIEWLEVLERKVRADKADRKTENSSEIPNNCEDEPQTNKDFKVTYTCSFTDCDNFKNFGFGEKCIECKRKQSEAKHKDEPQTNADQHVQHVESVETMSCQECKHWIFTSQWGWFCPLKGQDECHYEPIEDEPQTERKDK